MNLNCVVSLEIFLITMITVLTWNQDSKQLHQCSRERSRIVREVITKKWVPIFEQQHVAINTDCPFHHERDYLWWPNGHPDTPSSPKWTCPHCGLDFLCSDTLTSHWDKEHRHENRYRDDLVCLADYCDIFRCDVLIHKRDKQKKQNLIDLISFGHEEATKCDPEKMVRLEKSCRNVVRQCTLSLEANVSAEQFAQVEQELIGSLCSFLTCDHYNDDLFTDESAQSRKVPITLFSLLGTILACGFCLCYLLIWKFVQRALVKLGEQTTLTENSKTETNNNNDKLKLSFRTLAKAPLQRQASDSKDAVNATGNSNSYPKPKMGNFFQNIFEFSQEHKEDTFEFKDFNSNVADYERKLRANCAINSIIEEEDEERDESEKDISYNSYPIINRKYFAKQRSFEMIRPRTVEQSVSRSSHGSLTPTSSVSSRGTPPVGSDALKSQRKKQPLQKQEIFLHDLPPSTFKVHPKYIQPLKHSYSDRYPCYSGPHAPEIAPLTKSRSYSHSQLRNAQNYTRLAPRPRTMPPRQHSIEEEWDQKSQHSHSSMSIQSSMSAPKMADSNGKVRNTSKSSLSYNAMHPTTREEPQHQGVPSMYQQAYQPPYQQPFQQQAYPTYHQHYQHPQPPHHFAASSKSNSNASIASRLSMGSRVTANSAQAFGKR